MVLRIFRRIVGSKSEDLAYKMTDNSPIGPSTQDLQNLTRMSYKSKDCQKIFNVIHERIASRGKNWREKSKALTILQYFIIHGSPESLQLMQSNKSLVTPMLDYKYLDSNNHDQGRSVREKAKNLLDVLDSPERIEETKKNYKLQKENVRKSIGNGRPSTQSRNTLELLRESLFDDPDPTDLNGAFESSTTQTAPKAPGVDSEQPRMVGAMLSAIEEEH